MAWTFPTSSPSLSQIFSRELPKNGSWRDSALCSPCTGQWGQRARSSASPTAFPHLHSQGFAMAVPVLLTLCCSSQASGGASCLGTALSWVPRVAGGTMCLRGRLQGYPLCSGLSALGRLFSPQNEAWPLLLPSALPSSVTSGAHGCTFAPIFVLEGSECPGQAGRVTQEARMHLQVQCKAAC